MTEVFPLGETPRDVHDGALPAPALNAERHVPFFLYHLHKMPEDYLSLDSTRLSALYFVLSGLDAANRLDRVDAKRCVDWIYAQQVEAGPDQPGGFRGSPCMGSSSARRAKVSHVDTPHIAMTYTALACLLLLGDDLSRVDRAAISTLLEVLQQEDGSFAPTPLGGECDVRFVYCACAIATMLDRWDGVDKTAAVAFLETCKSYEGGFGLVPGGEAHGGATYVSLAALSMLGSLERSMPPASRSARSLLRWLAQRQRGGPSAGAAGFRGRPGKDEDTCYGWWVGASMQLLREGGLAPPAWQPDWAAAAAFMHKCEHPGGGFMKEPQQPPDIVHTHYSVLAFALAGTPGTTDIDARLAITRRAACAATVAAE